MNAVRFVVEAFVGPLEICDCSRCRKASGSTFVSGIGVRARDFRWVLGGNVRLFEAPVRTHAPGYQRAFFCRCGSPVPNHSSVTNEDDWFEIAGGGVLDEDPGVGPDRDVFVDYAASWDEITNGRPQCTERDVIKMRKAEWKEKRGRWSRC